jgi:hypothetical protein
MHWRDFESRQIGESRAVVDFVAVKASKSHKNQQVSVASLLHSRFGVKRSAL